LLQVNAGPLAIGDAFLSSGAQGAQQAALRDSMRRFLLTLQSGVETNRRLIGPDQQQFQVKLEEGLVRFIARVNKWGINVLADSRRVNADSFAAGSGGSGCEGNNNDDGNDEM